MFSTCVAGQNEASNSQNFCDSLRFFASLASKSVKLQLLGAPKSQISHDVNHGKEKERRNANDEITP